MSTSSMRVGIEGEHLMCFSSFPHSFEVNARTVVLAVLGDDAALVNDQKSTPRKHTGKPRQKFDRDGSLKSLKCRDCSSKYAMTTFFYVFSDPV